MNRIEAVHDNSKQYRSVEFRLCQLSQEIQEISKYILLAVIVFKYTTSRCNPSIYHNSSSSLFACCAGSLDLSSPPKLFDVLIADFVLVTPRASLRLLDGPASILCRKRFSSAPETLALCFFRGLPMKASLFTGSASNLDVSGNPAVLKGAVGDVEVFDNAGGVTPEPGDSFFSGAISSEEC